MGLPEFSIVTPVYNEAANIERLLRGIEAQVRGNYEILVVYDFDEDSTLPAIRALQPPVERVRLVKNELGRGVVNAIRAGFAAARGWLGVVVTMSDLSDPPECINPLIGKLRQGYDVVAGSRYMKGGRQFGGPRLKGFLSRMAGLLAYRLTGIGIHDVTTNFRAYSRRLLAAIPIESRGGFELGLELTVKCHLRGWRVGETPADWHDRSAGESRFRLFAWLPGYLRWYCMLLWGDFLGWSRRIRKARRTHPQPADYTYFGVYELPGYGWTARRFAVGVIVVAVDRAGRIILVRHHRPYHDQHESGWELPGGAQDPAESLLETAQRELREETGYHSGEAGAVLHAELEAIPGMGSFPHALVCLRGCEPRGAATSAHEGVLEVAAFDWDAIRQLIATGAINAMPTLAGLWYYRLFAEKSPPPPGLQADPGTKTDVGHGAKGMVS